MVKKIIDLFGTDILRRSALNLPNGAEEIKRFMCKKPIHRAVEIGTFRGITSALMSQYCNQLVTIDLKSGQYEKQQGKIDWNDTPLRHDIWDALEINNISLMLINNNTDKQEIINNLQFDFAFIDGDHSYEGVKADFQMVKHCGRVLFHDYDKAEGKDCPVRDFIHTIKTGTFEYTTDFAYWEA
jgi:predicted O-methyltransferase YrrM